MKIALYENLPPGGAKRAAFELGRYLATHHTVDLFRLSVTSTTVSDLAPHVNNVSTYEYRPLFGLLNDRIARGKNALRIQAFLPTLPRLHRRIARDIKEGGYDVVFANPDWFSNSPFLLRWLSTVPSVYYGQDIPRMSYEVSLRAEYRRSLSGGRPVLRQLNVANGMLALRRLAAQDLKNVASVTTLVVNSEHSRERFWATYGRDALVCYLGVDTDFFSPDPGVASADEVLSIGSLQPNKGHELVVQALATIEPAVRPALRVIAPVRYDAPWLTSLASDLGVELRIEAGIADDDLAQRYRQALLTVCAARLEPFGFVPLESMASGKPVVAVREGGYRESIVDGVTGFLTDRDPRDLGRAIAKLVDSPSLRARLGQSGREHVLDRWTWSDSGRRLEMILERTLAG